MSDRSGSSASETPAPAFHELIHAPVRLRAEVAR